MKPNKILKIIFLIFLTFISIFFLIKLYSSNNQTNYIVRIKKVDDEYSTDRLLEVYNNDKKVKYKEIQLLNNMVLCTYDNNAVYYGELEDIQEVIIVFENKNVKAKLEKENI